MRSNGQTSRPVWVGMSGGVDSSLAAALLVESGYACTGVTMDLGRGGSDLTAIEAAAVVCAHLGIPHRVIDLSDAFRAAVLETTARAYAAGMTPNPCVACNAAIKFGALLDAAVTERARLATGHYARVVGEGAGARLARASDPAKDQSYFLYRLSPEVLAHVAFPLGELTKTEVRTLASARGMSSMHTAESQDACFLGPGGYASLVRDLHPEACRPGPVLTADGTRIGTHDGVCLFTVGQRKGLGIASAGALYVTRIDAAANAVIVGPHDALATTVVTAGDAVWFGAREPVGCDVKIRYNAPASRALVTPEGASLSIEFAEPIFGAAPGQSAVCYQGDIVVGGGIIGGTQ